MVTITPIRNTNPGARDLRNPKPNPKPVISTGGRAPRQLCWLGWRRGAFAAVVEKSASPPPPAANPGAPQPALSLWEGPDRRTWVSNALTNPQPNSKHVISTGGAALAAVAEKSASQPRHSPGPNRSRSESGFTLLELMIVMVVIGLLAAIAIPAYTTNIRHAREAVLKEDLHVMRQAIDSYTVDKQKAPQSLDDLVQSGYLKSMPVDPFTHRSDTWMPVQGDTLMSLDQTEAGIDDVHSGSQETAIDGTSYNSW